jgi:hypothetical protein
MTGESSHAWDANTLRQLPQLIGRRRARREHGVTYFTLDHRAAGGICELADQT